MGEGKKRADWTVAFADLSGVFVAGGKRALAACFSRIVAGMPTRATVLIMGGDGKVTGSDEGMQPLTADHRRGKDA